MHKTKPSECEWSPQLQLVAEVAEPAIADALRWRSLQRSVNARGDHFEGQMFRLRLYLSECTFRYSPIISQQCIDLSTHFLPSFTCLIKMVHKSYIITAM